MLRLYVPLPLAAGARVDLPRDAARHVQVRRLQPGDELVLFDGGGAQWLAAVVTMGRSHVEVEPRQVLDGPAHVQSQVTLAVGMPTNERMDWLVEKACEIGAASIVPLVCDRSVLRLGGERAARRRAHWQAVAVAAAEQSGATTITAIEEVQALDAWLHGLPAESSANRRCVLSTTSRAPALAPLGVPQGLLLSGPEGGLSSAEEADAVRHGFTAASLGPRVLRAETAPLVALARWLA